MTGGSTTTTCEVVTVQSEDCSRYRPTFAPCGRDCLSPAVPEAGCGIDDFHCQCAPDKQAALSTLVRPCVEETCQDTLQAINWDPAASESRCPISRINASSRPLTSLVCACASGGRTSTTCYGATVTSTTTSSSTSTETSTEDDDTAGLQGAAGRYRFAVIVGMATAAFAAAIAL